MTRAARRRVVLARLGPVGVVLVALLWLLPFAARSRDATQLVDYSIGNWVVLGILLIWTTSLAVVVTTLERGGRAAGPPWVAAQGFLLAAVVLWSLPPLLLDGPAALEAAATWDAHFVLPVVALVLSALQGLFLFLRA